MPAGQMLPVERQGMDRALDLVRLSPMMARTLGRTEVIIGMIDGPVAKHGDLANENVRFSSSTAALTEID
jgi:hypothetical protein